LDRIDSKSKAYLLGLIVAKRRKENRVTLGFEDRAFLKSISKELLSFLPIEIESSKNKIDITFNSKEFLEQLNNFSIKSLDERFINSFVRGFFDIRGEIKSLKAYIC
jgi:hypothetical protein